MAVLSTWWSVWSCRSIVMVTVVLLLLDIADSETCHFPHFLQSSSVNGRKKFWSTRKLMLNLRDKPKWVERHEIYVQDGWIWRHREIKNCGGMSKRAYRKSHDSPCQTRTLYYNLTCLMQERLDTFRVIQVNADGSKRFRCMRFVKRSNNVVQVFRGSPSGTNDPNLCNDLSLDAWPWIAPWKKVSSTCPFSGGYSFRTTRRLTNEDLCENEWRKSTLEIECLRGDGMEFMAPKGSNCNPFLKEGDNKKLVCWAGWESNDFIFMIAADEGGEPSYCLRFPRIRQGSFTVMVYFSVICPFHPDGQPPPLIEYYELNMHRKDPSACRDDDHQQCQDSISNPSDSCIYDQSLYPHCAKTCGQCATTIMYNLKQRRCGFDPNLSGDWVLYDNHGAHDVIIDKQNVTVSQLGTFQCLNTGAVNSNMVYKTSSVFNNGCSPRYTCLEMIRKNNNILQYRIGPSYREELKMEELCDFNVNPRILRNTVRSFYMKNIILARKLWPSYCGLDGVISFNGTINGTTCQGTVSDWDEKSCHTRGVMVFHSQTCRRLVLHMEFQCLGFIRDESAPLRQLLLTRSMDGRNAFNCWVITKFFDGAEWPKPMMYQLPDAQCSVIMAIERPDYTNANIYIYLDEASRHKDCTPDDKMDDFYMTQVDVTKSNNVSYVIPHTPHRPHTQQGVHVKPDTHKGETRTNSPFQPLMGHASSLTTPYRQSFVFYSLLNYSLIHFIIFYATR